MTDCTRYDDHLRSFALGHLHPEVKGRSTEEDDRARDEAHRLHGEIGGHLEECPGCRDRVESWRVLYNGARHAELERKAAVDVRRQADSRFLLARAFMPLVVAAVLGVALKLDGALSWGPVIGLVLLATYIYNTLSHRILDLELTTRLLLRRVEELREVRRG